MIWICLTSDLFLNALENFRSVVRLVDIDDLALVTQVDYLVLVDESLAQGRLPLS